MTTSQQRLARAYRQITAEQRSAAMLRTLEAIARDKLDVPTLETRHSDSLDFHEVAAWNLRQALCEAYMAGRRAEQQADPRANRVKGKAP